MQTPVTKKNILRLMPCSEARLFQVFLSKGLTEKKADKLTDRLVGMLMRLQKKGILKRNEKLVITEDNKPNITRIDWTRTDGVTAQQEAHSDGELAIA